MKISRVWVLFVFAACGGETDELGTTGAPVISTTDPYRTASVDFPAYYPALGSHGRLPEAHWSQTSPLDAHSARFMDGLNTAAPRTTDACWDSAERATWLSAVASPTAATYLQSPNLDDHLGAALQYADLKLAEHLDASALIDAVHLFEEFIPSFHKEIQGERTRFTTWTPTRARWMDSQWHTTLHPAPAYPETHYRYPTPSGLAAMPERGARLYCAAREMARVQQEGSLGEQVLLPLEILGQHIDIGVVEASAYIDQPKKFGAVPDGAQAFSIPLALGTTITPIRPFLPPLPELRYPLVLTAADSEVVTDVGRELIYEDKRCFAFFCIPVIRPDFRTRYKTVSHVDAALSASQALKASATVPLFWAGPLLVELGLNFNAGVGRAAPPIIGSPDTCSSPDSTERPQVPDDRAVRLLTPLPGWPTNNRDPEATASYVDGPWNMETVYDATSSLARLFHLGAPTVASVALNPRNPMSSTLLANDDHHLRPTSELGLGATVSASLGFNASIARIEVIASGTLAGTLGLAHDVRDGVVLTSGLAPNSDVTITPRGYGDAKVQLKVTFHIHIDLWIGSIDYSYDLVDENDTIAKFDKPWDEQHRVRLGTGSELGDPTFAPDVLSHHGAGPVFASFPSTNTVQACLADPIDSPPIPPRCEGTFTPGEVPHTEMCMYVAFQDDSECANIPVVTNTSPLEVACRAATLTYICSPTSKTQIFDFQSVRARKMTFTSPTEHDGYEIERIADLCARAADAAGTLVPVPSPTGPDVTHWFTENFHFATCTSDATLVGKTDVISAGEASPVGAGKPCPTP